MKILITGSEGYIASNLKDYLKGKNIEIIGIDTKLGTPIESFKIEQGDFDYIIHLAGIPGIKTCADSNMEAVRDNISSSICLFKKSKKYSIPVIFTSSQAAKDPFSSFYAMCKYIVELEAMRLNQMGGNIKVFRLTNVYGGRKYLEEKTTVISNFINSYKSNLTLIVNGEGVQTRDFIHVKDVCKSIMLGTLNKKNINKPIDIGTGIETSINELASMFLKKFTNNMFCDTIGVSSNVANTFLAMSKVGFEADFILKDYINGIL